MKKCSQCNAENADAMNFCLQCGMPLAAAPPIFNAPDTLFSQSAETLRGGQALPANFAAISNRQPKNGKKIFLILGGVLSLFGLLLAAGALIVYFNWNSPRAAFVAATPSPPPTRGIADQPPSPESSASPGIAPAVLPPAPLPNAAPQIPFTPPVEPTKKGTFTVYANGGWQVSELDTVPLENYRTSVTGLIDLADIKTSVSSKGVSDVKTKSRRIYAEYPTGALMMRTRYADGKFSNVQPVTAAPSVGVWRNFPDERGRLEFRINDNAPEQNGGQFVVVKTSTNIPKAKK